MNRPESSPASAAAVSPAQQETEVAMNAKQISRISLAVLFAVAAAGVTAWTPAPTTNAAQPAPQMATSSDSFYYPAQYVNQAKEYEPHIQAF